MKLFFTSILIILISVSSVSAKDYTFATGADGTTSQIAGHNLVKLFNTNTPYKFVEKTGKGFNTLANVKRVQQGEIDFCLAHNDDILPNLDNIRSIVPLYNIIFYVAYRNDGKVYKNINELIEGKRVCYGPNGSGTSIKALALFQYYGIEPRSYKRVIAELSNNKPCDSIDVSIITGGFNCEQIAQLLEDPNSKLFSLDEPNLIGQGSSIDGFCNTYPRAFPFVIPRQSFGGYPDKPLLTFAVNCMLVCRKDIEEDVVNKLIKTVFENKLCLANENPLMGGITDKFDENKLSFPIHTGAKYFIERNEPSFLEKHTDIISLFITVVSILFGFVAAFVKWVQRKKKNRIDRYYRILQSIEEEIKLGIDESNRANISHRLDECKKHAFDLLISEKLEANESFRIFITYLNDLYHKVEKSS